FPPVTEISERRPWNENNEPHEAADGGEEEKDVLDCGKVDGAGGEGETGEMSEDNSDGVHEDEEEDLSYELQQARKIFGGFLLEKHKAVTAPFMQPTSPGAAGDRHHNQQPMSFRRMEEKFDNLEYQTITEFVADFRLMLENCYRLHGVDHWVSKQAQKLETMLEQKLTLLSRILREKTTLAVTSKGRFGIEEEKGLGNTSTRRRSVPRNLSTLTVGASESLMVQALRLEEQQRAKEEKRLRELEKKEAEEASAKELDDWERNLLAKATQWPVETLWELPAIGHFLCLAQTALNLPEIVFFELERCLLMPRCSAFLAKVMTSLLCHPQKRATLHRRPPLTYRRWEAALRHKVLGWYHMMGQAEDTTACAEQLGLCPQFFRTLGETSPLEEKPFHQLPFNQRVWLLKGLCDFVYENQKEVQNAVLSQPIHECRESILGYDGRENAYIHFPHFCGADLRIYCQSPSTPPEFPPPGIRVKRLDRVKRLEQVTMVKETVGTKGAMVLVDTEGNCVKKETGSCNSEKRLFVNSDEFFHHNHGKVCLEGNVSSAAIQDACSACGSNKDANQEYQYSCSVMLAAKMDSLECSFPQTSSEGQSSRMRTKKKKRKKKKVKDQGAKEGQTSKPDGTRQSQANSKVNLKKSDAAQKKKCKRKKQKSGEKYILVTVSEKVRHIVLHYCIFFFFFQLVCTSLDELRQLISKTEDELEELENTKKKSGKWYFRRQAVKDLHITLIRLLNELLPWEAKLVKAFQRNRARLKKDYDDFKKHPEYNSFVREEWAEEEGDGVTGKGSPNLSFTDDTKQQVEFSRRSRTPRRESVASDEHKAPLRTSKRAHSSNMDEELNSRKKIKNTDEEETSSVMQTESEVREPNPATENSAAETGRVMTPMASFQKGSKPIQALLAKSVGNKVTLISQPASAAMTSQVQNKAEIPSQPTTKPLTSPRQPSEPLLTPKSPVQLIYKVPESFDQLRKGSSPVKVPVLDQKTEERIVQQVIILPSTKNPHSENLMPNPVSTASAVGSTAPGLPRVDGTNVIPIQQVAPLTEICNNSSSFTPSPCLSASHKSCFAGVSQADSTMNVIPDRPSVTSGTTGGPKNPSDSKQELKTVCIRDSQSILVTTRGGNTGVVKVQTSDQAVSGFLATSPIITISPQFQAFLVSQSSPSSTSTPLKVQSTTGSASSATSVFSMSSLPSCLSQHPSAFSIPATSGQKVGTTVNYALNQTSNSISVPLTTSKCTTTTRPFIPHSSALSTIHHSTFTLHTSSGKSDIVSAHTSSAPCTTKPLVKKTQPEETISEIPSMQRVILVTSSSTVASPAVASKTLSSSTVSTPRLMFVSQTPASVDQTPVSIPKQTVSLTSVSQVTDRKIGLTLNQPTGNNTSSSLQKIQTFGLMSNLSNMLPAEALNNGKHIGLPLVGSDSKSTCINANVLDATSGGKTLEFSTFKTGHLVPSAISAVSHILINTAPTGPPATGVSLGKTQFQVPATSKSIPLKMSPIIPNSVSQSRFCNSPTPTKMFGTTLPATQTAEHSVFQTPGVSPASIQQKIVINTTTPLSPGSHIVINNTRFIVPAQGLGPGSHMLLISSPVVPLPGPQGTNPTAASQKDSEKQGFAVPSVQSPRKSPPTTKPLSPAKRHPLPTTVKVTSSYACLVAPQMNAVGSTVRAPLSTSNTTSAAQVSQILAVPPTTCQGLPNPLSPPSVLSAEGKDMLGMPVPAIGNQMKDSSVTISQRPLSLLSTAKPANIPGGLSSAVSRAHLTSAVPPVGAVISQTQVLPAAAVPPIGGTISRIQSLPVATVLPIGSAFSRRQASPIAAVPPSNSTVLIAPGQSVRTARNESNMSVSHTNLTQVLSKPTLQVTGPAVLANSSSTKLLVSPDGAILNAIRSPALSTPTLESKTLATAVVTSSSSTGSMLPSLKTHEPPGSAQRDKMDPSN
uniref:Bromodomain containing 10 n=1 Tax=Scleropages formosus TaxID=113540 RepID=A0A8C9V9P8_SCLFO